MSPRQRQRHPVCSSVPKPCTAWHPWTSQPRLQHHRQDNTRHNLREKNHIDDSSVENLKCLCLVPLLVHTAPAADTSGASAMPTALSRSTASRSVICSSEARGADGSTEPRGATATGRARVWERTDTRALSTPLSLFVSVALRSLPSAQPVPHYLAHVVNCVSHDGLCCASDGSDRPRQHRRHSSRVVGALLSTRHRGARYSRRPSTQNRHARATSTCANCVSS